MKPRATQIELAKNINEVKDFLLRGAPRCDIVDYAAKKWGVGTRTADEYIKKAKKEILSELESVSAATGAWHIAARMRLYYKTEEINDYQTALRILQDMAGLQGIQQQFNITPSEETGPPNVKVTITRKPSLKIVSEEEEKIAADGN